MNSDDTFGCKKHPKLALYIQRGFTKK